MIIIEKFILHIYNKNESLFNDVFDNDTIWIIIINVSMG